MCWMLIPVVFPSFSFLPFYLPWLCCFSLSPFHAIHISLSLSLVDFLTFVCLIRDVSFSRQCSFSGSFCRSLTISEKMAIIFNLLGADKVKYVHSSTSVERMRWKNMLQRKLNFSLSLKNVLCVCVQLKVLRYFDVFGIFDTFLWCHELLRLNHSEVPLINEWTITCIWKNMVFLDVS